MSWVDKLAEKAIKEARGKEPKWSLESAPILKIGGKVVTKEGVMLSIIAEREDSRNGENGQESN